MRTREGEGTTQQQSAMPLGTRHESGLFTSTWEVFSLEITEILFEK